MASNTVHVSSKNLNPTIEKRATPILMDQFGENETSKM